MLFQHVISITRCGILHYNITTELFQFFWSVFAICCIFYTFSTSHLNLAIFPLLSGQLLLWFLLTTFALSV